MPTLSTNRLAVKSKSAKSIQLFLILCLLQTVTLPDTNAQSQLFTKDDVKEISQRQYANGAPYIEFNWSADISQVHKRHDAHSRTVEDEEFIVEIPANTDGEIKKYIVKTARLLPLKLREKYPSVRAYEGYSLIDKNEKIRLDISPKGIYASIYNADKQFYIDAIPNRPAKLYLSADHKSNNTRDFECKVNTDKSNAEMLNQSIADDFQELRKYRIAIATTGEYSQFHGGSVDQVMAAIVTTLNRVTGIYERDVAITFELVEDNDKLIFLNPETDGYTNDDGAAMLSENQTKIDAVIGSSNYDIGHVFSTGGGGVAYLGSVCNSSLKAGGVTGLPNPIGDAFDVDYVCHEIGHQFRANHTFNGNAGSCGQWNQATAYEPGSGVTIMAYAGICGSQNIATQSIDNFHIGSIIEMRNFITTGGGSSCRELLTTTNRKPTVEALYKEEKFAPVNTPLILRASAFDPDNDPITYSWEQFDTGERGAPDRANVTTGPLFRPFRPTTDSVRFLPRLSDLVSGQTSTGEVLPAVERTLNFKVAVRDHNAEAGAVAEDDILINIVETNNLFKVNKPIQGTEFKGRELIEINWQVAGTNLNPFNAEFVEVWYSENGGLSFDQKLADNLPNNGQAFVRLPNKSISEARIMVLPKEHVFFNVNPGAFSVTENTVEDDFLIQISTDDNFRLCIEQEVTVAITKQNIGDHEGDVSLNLEYDSELISAALSNNTIDNDTVILTVNAISANQFEESNLKITATSGSLVNVVNITVSNIPGLEQGPEPIYPLGNEVNVSQLPFFEWENLGNDVIYTFRLYEDSSAESLLFEIDDLTSPGFDFILSGLKLDEETTYYWGVDAENTCGISPSSTLYAFTTLTTLCMPYEAEDLPKTISTTRTIISSTIEIIDDIIIENITVAVKGKHTYLSDLVFELIDPLNNTYTLINRPCGSDDDFDVVFDQAGSSNFNCPLTGGQIIKPFTSFDELRGTQAMGSWVLRIIDDFEEDGGSLDEWSISVCGLYADISMRLLRPENLVVNPGDTGNVSLSWSMRNEFFDGFNVYRKFINPNSSIASYELLAEVSGDEFFYTDTVFENSGEYQYAVSAVKDDEESERIESEVINVLALSDAYKKSVLIFPNPFNNTLNLKLKGYADPVEIILYDLSGKVLLKRKISEHEFSLTLAHLSNGIYLLRLYNEEGQSVHKIMKQ